MRAGGQDRTELELVLPSDPASIGEAREALGELAGRVGASERDVKIAASEAVSNSVIHAFRGRPDGTIRVNARVARGRLLVVIADDGTGMRPNIESPGLGVGISLITTLASDVRFESSTEGLTVSMSFDAPGVA